MSVNFKKQYISVNDRVCQDFAQIMAESEIIVNEAKPDILKIIQIDTKAFVREVKVSAGKAVISGSVDLSLLYLCEREGESLKGLNELVDFEHTVENTKICDNMTANVNAEVVRIDFDLLNSRKVRIKLIISLDTAVNSDKVFDMVYDVEDEDTNLQIQTKDVNVYTLFSNQNKVFDVQDELILPEAKPSIRDILKVNAKLVSKEVKVITGKAVMQGVIDVCTLYTNDTDGCVEFCQHDVHFTEVFDISQVSEEAECVIDVAIDEVKWSPKFDSDGNIRRFSVSMRMSSVANVSENISVSLITDCYVPGKECKVVRETYDFDEFLGESKAQTVVEDMLVLKDGMPTISRIYNVITKPYITSNTVSNGKVYVEGNIDTYVLYICEDTFSPIFSYKQEIPFSHTLDVANVRDNASCFVTCETSSCSYKIAGETKVEIRAVLDISVCLTNVTKCQAVQDVEIVEEEAPYTCAMVIYFVKKGDTLWDIGKRYRVPMEAIAELNGLTDAQVLREGQKLLIPHVKRSCPEKCEAK